MIISFISCVYLFSFLSHSWSVLSVGCLLIARCSVCWVSLFCCVCRFISRFKFRVFTTGICFFRVSFSSCNFFIVFMLFSFSKFEFLVCCWFSLLILSISFLISLSSFFLFFSSCYFCFNMISCVLIFDFISTLSFTNTFPVSFSFYSCIFRYLICWSLSNVWFILILSQFPNALTTTSNIFFSWLIFVPSFSSYCSFSLSFWCCSFSWSNCLFISSFSFIILSLILFIFSTSLYFNSYWFFHLTIDLSFGSFYICSVFPLSRVSWFPSHVFIDIYNDTVYNTYTTSVFFSLFSDCNSTIVISSFFSISSYFVIFWFSNSLFFNSSVLLNFLMFLIIPVMLMKLKVILLCLIFCFPVILSNVFFLLSLSIVITYSFYFVIYFMLTTIVVFYLSTWIYLS